jgi:sulfur carrier protein
MCTMRIQVNDEPRQLTDGCTVSGLLAVMQLGSQRVAIEVNRRLVPRAEHASHVLHEGDRVEVVTLVGGG